MLKIVYEVNGEFNFLIYFIVTHVEAELWGTSSKNTFIGFDITFELTENTTYLWHFILKD